MNISNGGPHILLFERDQQLAGLLISEFQLAGYECYTARTAVEVFDAIARQPIRMVLVNLAQAAAARREFWVALDTQRRGRGVQVFTFRCTNIAGYGPKDPEEHANQTMVDIEIDGMLGVMNLVESVRARVPVQTSTINTQTQPRITRPTVPTPAQQAAQQRSAPMPQITTNTIPSGTQRPAYAENISNPPATRAPQPANRTEPVGPQIQEVGGRTAPFVQPPPPQNPAAQQPTYTEKIRAVLYPNQRAWSPQNTASPTTLQQEMQTVEPVNTPVAPPAPPQEMSTTTMLQRLANGQTGPGESGLAQLSRMVQERNAPSLENTNSTLAYMTQPRPSQLQEAAPTNQVLEQYLPNNPPVQTIRPNLNGENLSTNSLRASPIQDLPFERTPGGGTIGDVARRTEAPSRAQNQPTSSMPPLASISAATQAPEVQEKQTTIPMKPVEISLHESPLPLRSTGELSATTARPAIETTPEYTKEPEQPVEWSPAQTEQESMISSNMKDHTATTLNTSSGTSLSQAARESVYAEEILQSKEPAFSKEAEVNKRILEQAKAEIKVALDQHTDFDISNTPSNAMLLDIMQSLPPMPAAPPAQQMQAQVLNGRATRSLGSVLLEGHLVPHSRLEVAQNIQRMLRGVDLNYQLGEILLMFKLLTPDQLLAASLVSYGMITTAQISALGRIRQELHAISLEYDLENLLILFRILTPEQLREVRSSWQ